MATHTHTQHSRSYGTHARATRDTSARPFRDVVNLARSLSDGARIIIIYFVRRHTSALSRLRRGSRREIAQKKKKKEKKSRTDEKMPAPGKSAFQRNFFLTLLQNGGNDRKLYRNRLHRLFIYKNRRRRRRRTVRFFMKIRVGAYNANFPGELNRPTKNTQNSTKFQRYPYAEPFLRNNVFLGTNRRD